MSEEIEYDEEVNCRHVYHEECMNSYVTKFKSHQVIESYKFLSFFCFLNILK